MVEAIPLLTLLSPTEMGKSLADRAKALRSLKGWTRDTLAGRAGIFPASLKRFETPGLAKDALPQLLRAGGFATTSSSSPRPGANGLRLPQASIRAWIPW